MQGIVDESAVAIASYCTRRAGQSLVRPTTLRNQVAKLFEFSLRTQECAELG
jgi:hypothetical protein